LGNADGATQALRESARLADPHGAKPMTQADAKAAWEATTGVVLDKAGYDKIYSSIAAMAKNRLEEQGRAAEAQRSSRVKKKRRR
jgi:hypothetical protein